MKTQSQLDKKRVKLPLIKEIQISRHMTTYGQTLGVFKREDNECIRKGERTKLHKIKILDFLISICGATTCISSPKTSS